MNGHRARVSSLAWNNHVLSSGGRDSQVTLQPVTPCNPPRDGGYLVHPKPPHQPINQRRSSATC